MIIKNDNVKAKKNYEGYAEQVIAKLIKSDTGHRIFFNILSDKQIKIPLVSIQDELKPLYRVTEKSIKYFNKLLAKYKITIDQNAKINPKTSRPIVTNDIYMPRGYRQHGKPITIYNRKHLPMVVSHD